MTPAVENVSCATGKIAARAVSWPASAATAKVAIKNGQADELRQIGGEFGQWISPELRALCRWLPRPMLAAIGTAKNALKRLRGRM